MSIDQTLLNLIVMGLCSLLGFFLNQIWAAVKELQAKDAQLAKDLKESNDKVIEKMMTLEILVAGNYVRREDLDSKVTALFSKLDRIEDKLDNKVDKP
jgi:outer membrane murein-binding lipoprotein Lpp